MNIEVDNAIKNQIAEGQEFLGLLGSKVRAARAAAGLTRKALSIRCGVSERHLAQVETGKGNISIRLLRQIANAVETPIEDLVSQGNFDSETSSINSKIANLDPGEKIELIGVIDQWLKNRNSQSKEGRIALVGLRGAGKSTIGKIVADSIGAPFIELDQEIEKLSGQDTAEIFSLYGEKKYREFERECLDQVVSANTNVVIAVTGGIVGEIETYSSLLRNCHTVWLTAEPEEHMGRVVSQGDRRPVEGNPNAMQNLKELLEARTPLYSRAHYRIDTSGKSPQNCSEQLVELINRNPD